MRRFEFILYVFFYEVVFGFSVYGFGYFQSMPFSLLWSIILGAPAVILLMNIKGKFLLPLVDGLLRVLYAIPFLVEYFIYMQFKELYDLNTIMNGAGGALTGFASTIRGLIFSPLGLLHLFLYSIPLSILIADIVRKKYDYTQPEKQIKIATAVLIPVCLVFNIVIIACIPSARTIVGAEYSYGKAVQSFGYMEGTVLDIKSLLFGSGGEFQDVKTPVNLHTSGPNESVPGESVPDGSALPGETGPAPTPTSAPEPQVMDIDFTALAQKGGKIATLAQYCANVEPTYTNKMTGKFKGKNLIMITAEAFTAEAIDEQLTPTLYRLANKGIQFTDSYVPATAGTTGGEFSHIFGLLPTSGGKSFTSMIDNGCTYFTMGQRLNAEGYYGQAFHNNDYKYYSRNKTHTKLGYNQGFMGIYNGMEQWVNYHQWPESDYDMFVGTCPLYINQDHFNIYYMSVSGHSGYTKAGNAMSKKHWDETASLDKASEAVRAYKACNMDLDQGLKYLIDRLEELGKADDTVICIVADHFPYGLDQDAQLGKMPYLSELYGYEVTNYVQRDHNRIIIWSGCLEKEDPIVVDTPTSSLDVLPTLMNLFGIKYDSRLLPGRDVFSDSMPLAFNLNYDWKTDLGTYYSGKGEFKPKDANTQIPENYVQNVKSIVSNKIKYCKNMVGTDFIKQAVGDPNK